MVKLSKQIGVRLPEEVYNLLSSVAEFRGEDISDLVRLAIYKQLADLSFLSKEQKKALGIAAAKQDSSRRERDGT